MKRTVAALGTTAAVLLGAAGAAHADTGGSVDPGCGGGYVAPALSSHLHYKPARWEEGAGSHDGTLGVSAPRGWSFVRTPEGEGRFHSRSGTDLLSLRAVTEPGSTADHMAEQAGELAGTSGLKVIGQHTTVVRSLDQTWSTLSYRYLSSMGEPRTVKVRWIALGTDPGAEADLLLTVAGRPLDGHGLDALLSHATPTVVLAG